jgi:nicotinamidase-related amidase
VLKPKHSGFYDTTLDTLLDTLRIRRVILTGIAGNICVLFTANDAYMRELKIFAPPTASSRTPPLRTTTRCDRSTRFLKGHIAESTRLRFRARGG